MIHSGAHLDLSAFSSPEVSVYENNEIVNYVIVGEY